MSPRLVIGPDTEVIAGETLIATADGKVPKRYGLERPAVAVENCRKRGKKDLPNNSATPEIRVDPDTLSRVADGELLTCEPAKELPMAQRYFLAWFKTG